MSDTPRTNRVTRARSEIASTSVVDSDFARTLERELSAAQNEVERLHGIIDGYKVAPDFLRLALREVKRYTGTRDEAYVVAAADVFLDLLTARRALDNPAEPGA